MLLHRIWYYHFQKIIVLSQHMSKEHISSKSYDFIIVAYVQNCHLLDKVVFKNVVMSRLLVVHFARVCSIEGTLQRECEGARGDFSLPHNRASEK